MIGIQIKAIKTHINRGDHCNIFKMGFDTEGVFNWIFKKGINDKNIPHTAYTTDNVCISILCLKYVAQNVSVKSNKKTAMSKVKDIDFDNIVKLNFGIMCKY
jgi:hypothetical protein